MVGSGPEHGGWTLQHGPRVAIGRAVSAAWGADAARALAAVTHDLAEPRDYALRLCHVLRDRPSWHDVAVDVAVLGPEGAWVVGAVGLYVAGRCVSPDPSMAAMIRATGAEPPSGVERLVGGRLVAGDILGDVSLPAITGEVTAVLGWPLPDHLPTDFESVAAAAACSRDGQAVVAQCIIWSSSK